MMRTMCRVKIHGATITEANLRYTGSITIPAALLRELDILEGEQVDVANINSGDRFTTYAIPGRKARHFCLNGAAARCGQVGDQVIILVFAQMEEAVARRHRMRVARMGPDNRVVRIG